MSEKANAKQEGNFVEQTERDHKPTEDTTEKIGAKEENASGQPRSWRRYIEETEAAEKKA